MIIATYDVNGVNAHLLMLLRWLDVREPDIVVLQELKAPQKKFLLRAIQYPGDDAIWDGQNSWNGVAVLSASEKSMERAEVCPGDPDDSRSRYVEAAVKGIVMGSLYPPHTNHRPGSRFDYQLRWFERQIARAAGLFETAVPVMLAEDFNVIPTEVGV